jgi:Ca2+/Na+ antiporter
MILLSVLSVLITPTVEVIRDTWFGKDSALAGFIFLGVISCIPETISAITLYKVGNINGA